MRLAPIDGKRIRIGCCISIGALIPIKPPIHIPINVVIELPIPIKVRIYQTFFCGRIRIASS
jgi:hypothetical protein